MNLFIIASLSSLLSVAQHQASFPIKKDALPISSRCYHKSIAQYNYCMSECVSYQSPEYITQLCSRNCNSKINDEFYSCLMKGK